MYTYQQKMFLENGKRVETETEFIYTFELNNCLSVVVTYNKETQEVKDKVVTNEENIYDTGFFNDLDLCDKMKWTCWGFVRQEHPRTL